MTLYQAFWFFIIYSFLGWCLEVCFCTVNTRQFVNRGFLNGPVCPIYGVGMMSVLLILQPIEQNLILLFLGGMLLTSAIELLGGWALEKLFHTSWWDYSDKKYNIGGYVCLQFSLAWGVGVVFAVRFLHAGVAWTVNHTPHVLGVILAVPVAIIFVCDLIVTIKAITKFNKDLGHIDNIARVLHEGSDVLAENLGDTALAVDKKVDKTKAEARERLMETRAEVQGRFEETRTEAQERLEETRAEAEMRLDIARAGLLDGKSRIVRRLMRAFPAMKHASYTTTLEQVKKWIKEKKE